MRSNDSTALFALPEHDEALAMRIAELLLAHGADPRFKGANGTTAAQIAERRGHDALADMLREASGEE